ncbi:MAG: HD domain-containing protein [Sphingobacteriales bacterium]|nr:MAG: HD domain-containing protein [Sphingobacteriales bacterium]
MLTTAQADMISKTKDFVRHTLINAEGGHDWWHINRVWNNAKLIAETEEQANIFIVELAALLHDIADAKFHGGNEDVGPETAGKWLRSIRVDEEIVKHVQQIIRYMSFKSSFGEQVFRSKEMEMVQDADRLDAIGAIGIARAFNYGGFKGRPLYDPRIKPDTGLTKEAYKNSASPTINHFYEKLLLLKDKINTATGKKLAEQRHVFMEEYLKQFYLEFGNPS